MLVNGTCPLSGTQLKTTDNPSTHPAGLVEERDKAKLDSQVNLAGWSEEIGASISVEEV